MPTLRELVLLVEDGISDSLAWGNSVVASPELLIRAAKALQPPGSRIVDSDERRQIIEGIERCKNWEDLPLGILAKLERMERINLGGIINLAEAGSSDSGHRGHRGIPGYRGGSLPSANTPLGWTLPSDETLAKHPEWMAGIIKAYEIDAAKEAFAPDAWGGDEEDLIGLGEVVSSLKTALDADLDTTKDLMMRAIELANARATVSRAYNSVNDFVKARDEAQTAYNDGKRAYVEAISQGSPDLLHQLSLNMDKLRLDSIAKQNALNDALESYKLDASRSIIENGNDVILALTKQAIVKAIAVKNAAKESEIAAQYRSMTPEEQATYENRLLTPVQPIKIEQREASVEGIKAAIADYDALIAANGGKTLVSIPSQYGGTMQMDFGIQLLNLKSTLSGITSIDSNDKNAGNWTAMYLRNSTRNMQASEMQVFADAIATSANNQGRILVSHLDKTAAQAQSAFDIQHAKMVAAGQKPTLDTYKEAKHVGDDLPPAGMFADWDKADTRGESRAAGGNSTLREIQHYQGFDGPAKVVPSHIFDEMAAKGSMYVVFRGLHTQDRTYAVRYGEHYPGLGIYGDGTYTSPDRAYTDSYTEDTAQMRMALAPGSRVVSFNDLNGRYTNAIKSTKAGTHAELNDQGSYAAWLGYDAIDCRGTDDTHMLVLNRTALLVDSRDYTAMGK